MKFCPYGPFFSLPAFSAFAALLCTWIASFDCSFYRIESTHDTTEHLQIGLWMVEDFQNFESERWGEIFRRTTDSNKCVLWKDSDGAGLGSLDAPLWIARLSSILACILSLPLFVAFMLPTCKVFPKTYFKKLAIFSIVEGALILLCMVSLLSDWCTDAGFCHLKFAGIVCLVAGGLWLVAGCTATLLKEDTYVEDAPIKSDRVGKSKEYENKDDDDDDENDIQYKDKDEDCDESDSEGNNNYYNDSNGATGAGGYVPDGMPSETDERSLSEVQYNNSSTLL